MMMICPFVAVVFPSAYWVPLQKSDTEDQLTADITNRLGSSPGV